MNHIYIWCLLILLGIVLIICSHFSDIIPNKLMFHPTQEFNMVNMPDYKEIYFNGLHGLLFDDAGHEKVLLHCHGNAGNMSNRGETYKFLSSTNADVFAFDYSGYGKSKGTPSEKQLYKDVENAYRKLIKLGYHPTDIIVYGESIGGGVATWLASQRKCGGLVLQSTFAQVRDLVPPILGPFCGYFPSIDRIKNVKCPILFAHSKTDEIIPYKSGKALYRAFRGEKRFYELQGGHNTVIYDEEYRDVLNLLIKGEKIL